MASKQEQIFAVKEVWWSEVVATRGAKKLTLKNVVKTTARCWATYQGAVKPILRPITLVKTG